MSINHWPATERPRERLLAKGVETLSDVELLANIATLLAATEIARRSLRQEIIGKNVIHDPESVLNYPLAP